MEVKFDAKGETCIRPPIQDDVLIRDHCAESLGETASTLRIALPANAADDLRCLFFNGPTWDGNVPSKSGRDELVRMGLAARGNGWQWLTAAGVQACFENGIHREKELSDDRARKRRAIVLDLAHAVISQQGGLR